MDSARLDHLVAGYLTGTLPPAEEAELADLVEGDTQARVMVAQALLIDRLIPLTAPAAFDVPLVMRALPHGRDASRVARIVRTRRLPRRWLARSPAPLLAAGLALAATAALWLVIARPARPAPAVAPIEVPAVIAVVRLEGVRGAVAVTGAGGDHPGRDGEALAAGAGVRTTGAIAGAVIVLDDGTRLELGADTSVAHLDAARGDGVRLELAQGRLHALVAKQRAGHTLAIATPQATATVVGTAFTLAADGTTTLLEVDEGRVRLASADGSARRLVDAGGFAETSGAAISAGRTALVAVDHAAGAGVSRFAAGFTHLDNGLLDGYGANQAEAVRRAAALLGRTATYQNTHLMAFGIPDPWDDPAQPPGRDWAYLDARIRLAVDGGAQPVITLCQAPWWMKGRPQADGSTRLLTRADEWAPIAYDARIRDDRIDAWLTLVRAVAARYLPAPFAVRRFQVWDRLAGYRDPRTGGWDMDDSPGDPTRAGARHGYTYLFNRTCEALKDEARRRGVDPREVEVGGPGVPVSVWRDPAAGAADRDGENLAALRAWLQAERGADFICVHGDDRDPDGAVIDPLVVAGRLGDAVRVIRALPGAARADGAPLPIWWTKWSVAAPSGGDQRRAEAAKAAVLAAFVAAGVDAVLPWGGSGEQGGDMPLWTRTDRADGGQVLPWQATYLRFRERFGAGTALLAATSSDGALRVLASPATVLLIDLGGEARLVHLGDATVRLEPYEIRWLDAPPRGIGSGR